MGQHQISPRHLHERDTAPRSEGPRHTGNSDVVRTVTSKAGRPEDGTDPKPINMAEFFVDLKPPAEMAQRADAGKTDRRFSAKTDRFAWGRIVFLQPIRDNVLESISQIDGQIVIKVFGATAMNCARRPKRSSRRVAHIRGVGRAYIDRAGQVPQLQIEVDRAKCARYGLNVADIQDVIETALGGKEATEVWEGERRFGVAVRLKEDERGIDGIKRILVDTPDGRAYSARCAGDRFGQRRQHEHQP